MRRYRKASSQSLRTRTSLRGSERSVEDLTDHHNDGLAWIRDVLPLYPPGFYKPGVAYNTDGALAREPEEVREPAPGDPEAASPETPYTGPRLVRDSPEAAPVHPRPVMSPYDCSIGPEWRPKSRDVAHVWGSGTRKTRRTKIDSRGPSRVRGA